MSDITLRPRTGDDVPRVAQLMREVHLRDGYPVRWPDDPAAWLDAGGALGAWVACDDKEIVGNVSIARPHTDDVAAAWVRQVGCPAERLTVITRLLVAPEHRGRGIGALLLEHATESARQVGHPVLQVRPDAAQPVSLYRSRGWVELDGVETPWLPRGVRVKLFHLPDGVS